MIKIEVIFIKDMIIMKGVSSSGNETEQIFSTEKIAEEHAINCGYEEVTDALELELILKKLKHKIIVDGDKIRVFKESEPVLQVFNTLLFYKAHVIK